MSRRTDRTAEREAMVAEQIVARGLHDPRVLAALRSVPRERFVPDELQAFAYADGALPIAAGQTISQPHIVAMMAAALALRGDETVLEVGTGSGYAAAVLARLAARVCTVERIAQLADAARERLMRLGIANVAVHCADGTLGWPAAAPFDAISVAAAAPRVPRSLRQQLAIGGRLVMPVGRDADLQMLLRMTRCSATRFEVERLLAVRFVPLLGAAGHGAASPVPPDAPQSADPTRSPR